MEEKSGFVCRATSAVFESTVEPSSAHVQILGMDKTILSNCMVTGSGWYKEDCCDERVVRHSSDEVLMFLGGDIENPDDLNAEIEIWLENDRLVLDRCCAVYIPAGVAHGKLRVSNLEKPVAYYFVQTTTDEYDAEPAEPVAPAGTYAGHVVEDFRPSSGVMPNAPEGLLTLLVWIDGGRIESAPYAEAVWFNRSSNEGPEPHVHDYGEFLSFIGSDPEHPEDLGCSIDFYVQGEKVQITQSCLIYIPAGVEHCPFYIHDMVRPILHTSGYAGSDYRRVAQG